MKRLMLSALAALCAILALPAIASALPAHLDKVPNPNAFTVHGPPSTLTSPAGVLTGTTTTGTGSFETTTTGTVHLTFHHVTAGGVFNCTGAGQPTGTVTTTNLTFHLVMLATNKPGILLTGGPTVSEPGEPHNHFATFNCGIFVGNVIVKGNGLLGTITSPECGKASNTAKLKFGVVGGAQEHTEYTGVKYGLTSSVGGGAFQASTMEAEATLTFGGGQERSIVCTH